MDKAEMKLRLDNIVIQQGKSGIFIEVVSDAKQTGLLQSSEVKLFFIYKEKHTTRQ